MREIQNLKLPQIDTKGIFIARKLKTNPNPYNRKEKEKAVDKNPVRVADFDTFRNGTKAETPDSHRSITPIKPRLLDMTQVRSDIAVHGVYNSTFTKHGTAYLET